MSAPERGQVRSGPAVPTGPLPPTVGIPKTGLRVDLLESPSRLELRGRADPVLLYFVFGAALAVAIGGSVLVSPQYGIGAVVLFSVLFAPLLLFSSVAALRLSTSCVVDRAAQSIQVRERSFLRTDEFQWPLALLQRVRVLARPPGRWASGGRTYELYLDLGDAQYLARTSSSEAAQRREAHRLGRFLGVPVETLVLQDQRPPISARGVALLLVLFFVPIAAVSAVLAVVLGQGRAVAGLTIVAMTALMVCQVGVLLAYSYYRSRGGRVS